MSAVSAASAGRDAGGTRFRVRLSAVRLAMLWLFVACGAVASIEPSPYEIMFVVAVLTFGVRELLFDRSMIPLVLGQDLFNIGGVLALAPFIDDPKSTTFIAISIYIAITSVFFAALVAKDPLRRMRTIRSGYVMAGFIASCLGILGYFDFLGLGSYLTLNGRASSTFKDPNVFGPFLVPPTVWLAQDIILQRGAGLTRRTIPFVVMLLALLLSFSRGAWGVWAASTGLMIGLTFVTAQSSAVRRRIVILAVFGLVGILLLLVVALSIPQIRAVFEIRASLSQDYDLGELGRFGAQVRSIPMLLDLPMGFGPLQYRNHFYGLDPHQTFINAFASYGWIGGLSYLVFIVMTLYAGSHLVFQRTPYQAEAIPVCACLFVQIIQGIQIDTDHWRHLYLLFGAMYGLLAASRLHLARQKALD